MEEPQEYLRIRNLKVGFEVFGGFVNVLDLSELDVLRRES